MTAGGDGKLKTWDILDGKPSLVYDQQRKLGGLLCLEACPDLPFTVCLGGENKNHNFTVVDAMDVTAGEKLYMFDDPHDMTSVRYWPVYDVSDYRGINLQIISLHKVYISSQIYLCLYKHICFMHINLQFVRQSLSISCTHMYI